MEAMLGHPIWAVAFVINQTEQKKKQGDDEAWVLWLLWTTPKGTLFTIL